MMLCTNKKLKPHVKRHQVVHSAILLIISTTPIFAQERKMNTHPQWQTKLVQLFPLHLQTPMFETNDSLWTTSLFGKTCRRFD